MRPFLLFVTVMLVGCTEEGVTQIPGGDGYGPVGSRASGNTSSGNTSSGGSGGSGSSGSSTPPPPTSTGGSSQPPPSWDAGTGNDAGSAGWGYDAGSGTPWDASTGGGGYDAGTGDDSGVSSQLLTVCVSEINSFRAQNGVFPYTESAQLEAYAAQAAASDARSGQRHGYFDSTNGGGGVAETEDEIDGDEFNPGGTVEQTLEVGLQDIEEGNGGGFDNLVTEQLSEAGCGFAQDAEGNWWIDIAFH